MQLFINPRIACLLFLLVAVSVEGWSWGEGSKDKKPSTDVSSSKEESHDSSEGASSPVVDNSERQGRQVSEYDDSNYSPVDDSIQQEDGSNFTQPRHLVKDRLCDLGLGSCDEESIEPKRPYISPEEVIYAQPVGLKPVGRPITAIPIKGGHSLKHGPPGYYGGGSNHGSSSYGGSNYGGSSFSSSGPGYGPPRPMPFSPSGPGPIYSRPPNSKISAPIYGGNPNRGPQVYEPNIADTLIAGSNEKKPVVVVNSQHSVQEHVHHHFHHADNDVKGIAGVVNPSPISNTFDTGSNIYPSASNNYVSPRPIYNNNAGAGSLYGTTGSGFAGSSPSYGGGVDSYGSNSPFYKKEYNVKRPYINPNSVSSPGVNGGYADKYPSYESPRLDNSGSYSFNGASNDLSDGNCYCVPYDQCLPHEISRNDGLLIDPRSNNKNIEAIGLDDVIVTDGNGTIISHHVKRDDEESSKESIEEEKTTTSSIADKKERRRREAGSDSVADESKIQARRRKFHLGGGGGGASNDDEDSEPSGSGLRIKPTFGVSFGLPQGGGGSYPVNPYGPYPHINPYGGSFGGSDGLNLGLVNLNPLVSLQVTKDEEGEKVLKPFVNLHVTPNKGLVHKFGDIIHGLKGHGGYGGYGGGYPPIQHQHYHSYRPQYGPPPYRPHYSGPPSYGPPPSFRPSYESYGPSYAPSYHKYRSEPYDNILNDYEPSEGYDNDDDNEDYFRNSKGLAFNNNNQNQQNQYQTIQNDNQQNQYQTIQNDYQQNQNFAFRSENSDAANNQEQNQNYALRSGETTNQQEPKSNNVAFPSDRRSSNAFTFENKSNRKRRDTTNDRTTDEHEESDVQKVSPKSKKFNLTKIKIYSKRFDKIKDKLKC